MNEEITNPITDGLIQRLRARAARWDGLAGNSTCALMREAACQLEQLEGLKPTEIAVLTAARQWRNAYDADKPRALRDLEAAIGLLYMGKGA